MIFDSFAILPMAVFYLTMPMIIISLIVFGIWVWALVDCLTRNITIQEKLLWVLVIVFLNIIGVILYMILGRTVHSRIRKHRVGRKRLVRSDDRVLGGVCGGIADYLRIDPTVIRLVWILITLFTGFWPGILAYIIAWIIIPEKK